MELIPFSLITETNSTVETSLSRFIIFVFSRAKRCPGSLKESRLPRYLAEHRLSSSRMKMARLKLQRAAKTRRRGSSGSSVARDSKMFSCRASRPAPRHGKRIHFHSLCIALNPIRSAFDEPGETCFLSRTLSEIPWIFHRGVGQGRRGRWGGSFVSLETKVLGCECFTSRETNCCIIDRTKPLESALSSSKRLKRSSSTRPRDLSGGLESVASSIKTDRRIGRSLSLPINDRTASNILAKATLPSKKTDFVPTRSICLEILFPRETVCRES